jgi:hypothetical protein
LSASVPVVASGHEPPTPAGLVPKIVVKPKRTSAWSCITTVWMASLSLVQAVSVLSVQTSSPPTMQWNMLPDRSTTR